MASEQLSQEELREARLRALGRTASGDRPPSADVAPQAGQTNNEAGTPLTEQQLQEYLQIMWSDSATLEDRERWHSQGFSFTNGHPSFGLQQGHGGPCGVLAAVQAEIVRYLVFGPEAEEGAEEEEGEDREGSGELPGDLGPELLQDALVQALVTILHRVRPGGGGATAAAGAAAAAAAPYAVVTAAAGAAALPLGVGAAAADLRVRRFARRDQARAYLASQMNQFGSGSGIILFVLSILLTHGLENVKNDFDGPDCTLTAQFGHCSQELLNLLLCGQASSNVFDGEVPMGESGLTLKGVPRRAAVGYLTHLEALRYCQVGSYYKSPVDPVWVLGSTSHFTVMFGLDKTAVTESEGEKLLARVRRAFGGEDAQGDGYIRAPALGAVLRALGLPAADDPHQLSALTARLEVAGAGIILWEEFWKVVSLMMTGGTLETILAGDAQKPETISASLGPVRERTDSDLARALQAEFDGGGGGGAAAAAAGAASAGAGGRPRSDSDLARELQAQFDAGGDAAMPDLVPVDDAPAAAAAAAGTPPRPAGPAAAAGAAAVATPRRGIHRHDSVADEAGPAFVLYHYNGQRSGGRGPTLTRFAVVKRGDENAVGESVPAVATGAPGQTYACPIEEVLHTKWPGCRTNWFGANAPSID